MTAFSKFAIKVRHSKLLKNTEWLWNILRKPYHFFLNFNNTGVTVNVGESLIIRVPPEFYKANLAEYEKESTDCMINWITTNPNCYIIDIGCSIGYISAVALFASNSARVVGIDSDLPSLKATLLMCQYAPLQNLQVIYGLICDEPTVKAKIDIATSSTQELLNNPKITGKPGTTSYITLDIADNKIPRYSIDDLYKDFEINVPVLVKCDIEGAELLALHGADHFIDKNKPSILLSVHPDAILEYNCKVEDVRNFLQSKNYNINIIAIDHEEHWWCTT